MVFPKRKQFMLINASQSIRKKLQKKMHYRIIQYRRSKLYEFAFPNKIVSPFKPAPVFKAKKIIVVTTLFNACKSVRMCQNYTHFCKQLKKQGIDLLVAEVSFVGQPFFSTQNDAKYVWQLRSDSILWQKERLYNKAIIELPAEYDAIVFMDCDSYFELNNWITKVQDQLQNSHFVQPYSKSVRLLPSQTSINIKKIAYGIGDGKWFHSFAYGLHTYGKRCLGIFSLHGEVGMALAGRRASLQRMGGFYDASIVGCGDILTLYGICNAKPKLLSDVSRAHRVHFFQWSRAIPEDVQFSISYVDQVVYHMWHGKKENRQYASRNFPLKLFRFSPVEDIKISSTGVWEWNSPKDALHTAIKQYFLNRKDDE